MSETISIDSELESVKNKRKEAILKAFDGRTQQFISEKTKIDFIKLNRWINGTGSLESSEIERLNKVLGTHF